MEPINVWEELDGIPKYQVSKFHVIAENNAAKITTDPVVSSSFDLTKMGLRYRLQLLLLLLQM